MTTKKNDTAKKPTIKQSTGIIATITDIVSKATKAKPVTKDQIVKALVKKFPHKNKASMANTVKVQVTTRLRKDKGLNVVKTEDGAFYVAA